MSEEKSFAFRARDASGADVSDTVRAPDRKSAILQVQQRGVALISLEEKPQAGGAFARTSGGETESDRLLVLQQIAVLARAGIPILEAVGSIAQALQGRAIAGRLAQAETAMRRGESIASALKAALPEYPAHVHALVRVGEANGNLADVLDEAVRQLRHQYALRRDVLSALTYPAFLLVAALAAVTFLFLVVVPRFAEMLGRARENLTGLSRFVLDTGMAVHGQPWLAVALVAAVAAACAWFALAPDGRRQAIRVLSTWPVVGPQIVAAQRADWARLMALATMSGVGILDATAMAYDAAPAGRFRDSLTGSSQALRRGEAIADAFGASGALDAIDMSLLRTGQKSGRLGAMFAVIADRHEESVRANMKRMTAVLEQCAIAVVAAAIGVVVIGLVGAMTSMYESIG